VQGSLVCQLDSEVDCHKNSDCPGNLICAPDQRCRNECATDKDCVSGQICVEAACANPAEQTISGTLPPPSSCSDGQRNGTETDVDCGGRCAPCADAGETGGAGGASTGGTESGGTSPGGGGTGGTSTGGTNTGGTSRGGAGGAGGSTGGAPASGGTQASGGSDGGVGEGGPPDSGAGSPALTVTAVDTFVTDTGTVPQPIDLAQFDVAVLTYDTTANAFSSHPTVPGGSGFTVDSLPGGVRYVRFSRLSSAVPVYILTTSNTLDLGQLLPGRPNAVPATSGTRLLLNVTNMTAWQTGDALDFYSAGANDIAFSVEATAGSPPAVSDTSLANFTIDAGGSSFPNLIDGPSGDRAFLLQKVVRSLPGGDTYQALDRAAALPSFSMTAGNTTTVSGSFTGPGLSSVDADWKESKFEAAMTEGTPGAQLDVAFINGFFQPAPNAGAVALSAEPDAFVYSPSASGDVAARFAYLNPFTTAWRFLIDSGLSYYRPYQLPGTTSGTFGIDGIDTKIVGSASVTLEPLVGPITSLTIGGRDARGDVTGVGTTPQIDLGAPSFGTPSGYDITFFRLSASSGNTKRTIAGRLITTLSSFRLPPGYFTTGNIYTVTVRVRAVGNVDMNVHPFGSEYPDATAGMMSGTIAP
jgi:hypothetical protein